MIQRRTRAMVGILGLVLVTVGVVDLGQAWAKDKPRFTILSKDTDWVLDSTTALQWQLTPGSSMVWSDAVTYCTNQGGGARLPEVKQLISLVDYSVASPGPVLPPGHPFTNVESVLAGYWSATTVAGNPSAAWLVGFDFGFVTLNGKTFPNHAWCVR